MERQYLLATMHSQFKHTALYQLIEDVKHLTHTAHLTPQQALETVGSREAHGAPSLIDAYTLR